MTLFDCRRARRALRTGTPEAMARLEAHAAGCGSCRGGLALWKEIPAAGASLHRAWPSPGLFARIERAIANETNATATPAPEEKRAPSQPGRFRWVPAAALAALVIVSTIGLNVFRNNAGREPLVRRETARQPLLTEEALDQVEGAEMNYLKSIENLSRVARPRIERPGSPLLVSYREKLLLLDSAIAECRNEIRRNQFNTNLRSQLLAMYREKQRTLQQLVEVQS